MTNETRENDPSLALVEFSSVPKISTRRCYLHAERDVAATCASCGNLICDECDVLLAQKHHCKKCLAEAEFSTAPLPPPFPMQNAYTGNQERSVTRSKSKCLERSRKDVILGGVCGGFAKYSDNDPAIIRVLFLLLLFFTGGSVLLVYIVMWAALPLERMYSDD